MDGSQWIPYQPTTFPTPPFPEYISGHSTFSAAGATILFLWTGSDKFGDSVTFPPGSSVVEAGITPKNQVMLEWKTFTDAADEAGSPAATEGFISRLVIWWVGLWETSSGCRLGLKRRLTLTVTEPPMENSELRRRREIRRPFLVLQAQAIRERRFIARMNVVKALFA
jgi:hypothetical protein